MANVFMNRGLALLMKHDDANAQKDFDQCLALDPSLAGELKQRIELAKELRPPKQ
jgi:hypothetical protein